jgi:threonine dehydratase
MNKTELFSLSEIQKAAQRIKPYIHHTPVMKSTFLNELSKADLFFKCENFQKAGAFKSRGAMNAILSLNHEELSRGVATHSSGNHAQALARAAQIAGTKAYIVMPDNAPKVKIAAVEHYKGEIFFCEPTLAARESTLQKVTEQTGAEIIHPYNDYRVILGQATACLELIEQIPDLDLILCPVGGGGLLSGTSLTLHYVSPKTKLIGCEPLGADDAQKSFVSGVLVPSINPKTIADGLLTSLGSITFPIIMKYVTNIITVDDEAIKDAMKYIWERMKILVEPSAAVPLAVALSGKVEIRGLKVGIILSGGNVDINNLPWKQQ